jgi:hypothetical protein
MLATRFRSNAPRDTNTWGVLIYVVYQKKTEKDRNIAQTGT